MNREPSVIEFPCRLSALIVLLCMVSLNAKTATRQGVASNLLVGKATLSQIKQTLPAFEAALTPYFQNRAGIKGTQSGPVAPPSDADLFAIARHWNLLSPSFKELYALGIGIPAGWKMYVSPGNNFEIWYDTTGHEPVDAADAFGYDKSDWRNRQHVPNGVPDYVDEVAYAADSAWSMEIDGFGFVKPLPLVDADHPSSRYKICIRKMTGYDATTYGYTWPSGNAAGGMGIRSYTEIRSEWNGSGFNRTLDGIDYDYGTHPEKAVGVTCCHEFFHGVQFAMTRQYSVDYNGDMFLDGFPSSWLEGTAVLMEGLGFEYAHDYIQYVSIFFDNPTAPIFVWTTDNSTVLYMNGLTTHYLYEFAYPSPKIDFVKDMEFNNYQQSIRFKPNLDKSSTAAGRSWADILGNFYAASYYTGTRAVPGRFIKDAPLIVHEWTYSGDSLSPSGAVTKSVNPFGMNTFSYVRKASDNAILALGFVGDTIASGDTDTNAVWSVRCILKKDSTPAHDSIVAIPLSSKGTGSAVITGWNSFTEALVIAANARYDTARTATLEFLACGVTLRKGATAVYSSGEPATAPNATVSVYALADLPCTLTITQARISTVELQAAIRDSLIQVGSVYDVEFPLSWTHGATLQLSISESRGGVHTIAAAHHVSDSSVAICGYNAATDTWSPCATITGHGDSANGTWQCTPFGPGLYGLFVRAFTMDTATPFVAYPNPVRLSTKGKLLFRGKSLLEVWVYTINGTLIAHDVKGQNDQPRSFSESAYGFDWLLRNAAGAVVSPGVYYAVVGYEDFSTKGMKKQARKIFVLP
jgi:hypothetical protein